MGVLRSPLQPIAAPLLGSCFCPKFCQFEAAPVSDAAPTPPPTLPVGAVHKHGGVEYGHPRDELEGLIGKLSEPLLVHAVGLEPGVGEAVAKHCLEANERLHGMQGTEEGRGVMGEI